MYDYRKSLPAFDATLGIDANADTLYAALEMMPGFISRRYWKFCTMPSKSFGAHIEVSTEYEPFVLLLHFLQGIKEHPEASGDSVTQLIVDYCGPSVLQNPGHKLWKEANRLLSNKDHYFHLWTVDEKPQPKMFRWS